MPKKQTYTAMMDELQSVLRDLQSTELDVDQALTKYERGRMLIKELESYLASAENKIVRHDFNVTKGLNQN